MDELEVGQPFSNAFEILSGLDFEQSDIPKVLQNLGYNASEVFQKVSLPAGLDVRRWSIELLGRDANYFREVVLSEGQTSRLQRGSNLNELAPSYASIKSRSRDNRGAQFVERAGVSRAKRIGSSEAFSEAEIRVDQARSQKETVLSFEDLPSLERLPNLDGLNSVVELRLRLTSVRDISNVSALSNLERLNLEAVPLNDLSPIISLEKINSLHLKKCKGFSLSPLKAISGSLLGLNVSRTELNENQVLGDLNSLEWLNVSYTSTHSQLNALKNLTKLFAVGSEIAGPDIEECVGLEHLDVDYCNKFTNMRRMTNLHNLKTFSANGTPLANFSRLESFPSLQKIYVKDTNVESVSRLGQCGRLRELSIDGCDVSDIYPLKACWELVYLSANNSKVRDISALQHLPNLDRIELKGLEKPIGYDELRKRGVRVEL